MKNKSKISRRDFSVQALKKAIKQRRIATFTALFILLPVVFTLSVILFKNENYILLSLIVLIIMMLPFFLVFELRNPRARDVVLIAIMTAITVVANVLCTHTVPLHAGTALVIITGISLGPEAGFLTGALSRLLCNVFDGQGPWTPWQMVAWGIMGLLGGIAFNRIDIHADSIFNETIQKKSENFKIILGPVLCIVAMELIGLIIQGFTGSLQEFFGIKVYIFGFTGLILGVIIQRAKLPSDAITITVFTFFVTLIIYGGLMNLANMLMLTYMDPNGSEANLETLKAVYVTGLPYDLQHAAGAAFTMFLIGNSMLRKIERIKIKYGMLI
ncbi:MAG: ECF transporter S component [Lachnospiraceae bacterium]|nr:ECF transporter S component [Lachnospiraceae bacterium]